MSKYLSYKVTTELTFANFHQSISTVIFSVYLQRLTLGVLAFRANLSSDLYAELDCKQVHGIVYDILVLDYLCFIV